MADEITMNTADELQVTDRLIIPFIEANVTDKIVIYDFARQMEGATEVKCSEFVSAIVDRL